jgi:hypothetical protein
MIRLESCRKTGVFGAGSGASDRANDDSELRDNHNRRRLWAMWAKATNGIPESCMLCRGNPAEVPTSTSMAPGW